jgi:hypothetical protein
MTTPETETATEIETPSSRAAALFPLRVTAHFAPGGGGEIVDTPARLLDAVLTAVSRSPIGQVTVAPATDHRPPTPPTTP